MTKVVVVGVGVRPGDQGGLPDLVERGDAVSAVAVGDVGEVLGGVEAVAGDVAEGSVTVLSTPNRLKLL